MPKKCGICSLEVVGDRVSPLKNLCLSCYNWSKCNTRHCQYCQKELVGYAIGRGVCKRCKSGGHATSQSTCAVATPVKLTGVKPPKEGSCKKMCDRPPMEGDEYCDFCYHDTRKEKKVVHPSDDFWNKFN